MKLEIMTFVISVPIPIQMPRSQCRGLQMASKTLSNDLSRTFYRQKLSFIIRRLLILSKGQILVVIVPL